MLLAFFVPSFLLISATYAQQSVWGQCGGIGWTGATTCAAGSVCTQLNPYYFQCLPSSSTTTSTVHSTTSTTTHSTTATTSIVSRTSSTSTTIRTTSTASTTSRSTTTATSSTAASASASGAWATAIAKAKTLVAGLSVQQQVNVATGIGWQKGYCVGNIPAVGSFPGLCVQDSPVGVRYADSVSAFPAGINAAATWNVNLMQQRGAAMGAEFKAKGVHVALGPMMNMVRVPAAGRNWEGFGADPFLAGEAAYATVQGMQSSGVQACAKHYINNEQEHSRDSESSVVDDRTEHEIYLHPFLKSVQAGVASVMCSYNQINSSFACENQHTLNGLLKGELGFQGYVMSDWWATHSTTAAANNGLDMTMPGDKSANSGDSWFGSNLVTAVNSNQVTPARLADMATRIVAAWYLLGQDQNYPAVNFDSWDLNNGVNKHLNVQGTHASLIRQIDAAAIVLLKNVNNALPLNKPKSIGIIGNDAGPSSKGPNGYTDRGGDDGVLGLGWGSGTVNFPYLTTPLDAITSRASQDGTTISSSLSDSDTATAANIAKGKDAAIVFINTDSGEGYITVEGNVGDRNNLNAWHSGDNLVLAVAAANKNTIVVVNSVGPMLVEAWVNHVNVTAILWAGVPGQEAGDSVTDVLYGAVNPSGRLPYTIAKLQSDYPAQVQTSGGTITYTEGLFIDYRWFDSKSIAPRYEFGFGLSYTTFSYSALTVTPLGGSGGSQPTGPGSSLDPWLHNPWVTVTFTVSNTGTIAGTEIPQVYVSPPSSANSPPSQLRGFTSLAIAAGSSTQVTITLSRYSFSIWNTQQQLWTIPSGSYGIWVGASSRDKQLTGSIAF